MRQILCLSHIGWRNRPTRTQQLLSRLPHTSVLFFEPPTDQNNFKGRKVRSNIVAYSLPRLIHIGADTVPIASHNCRRTAAAIEKAMARHQFRDPLLWCTSPEDVRLLDYLGYHGLIYDCQRYWNDLPIVWEGELASSADLCFAASDGLVDRLSPCNTNIALLPNGVNLPLFRRENAQDLPPDVADLKGRTVLGFVGTLSDDLIITPVLNCAEAHPDWIFLMLGPITGSDCLHQLERQENIRILGPRPLLEIPDYLSCCSACFLLLRRWNRDSDVAPARLYEYLATGKPVISMIWSDQKELFPDVVYYARTSSDFLLQCRRAVNEKSDILVRRRREYGESAAWSERSRVVAQLLEDNGF